MERKSNRIRKSVLTVLVPILVVLVLLVTLTATGVFASLIDSTSRITYTLKPAAVKLAIGKDYTVSNRGDIPVLVRAKLIVNWVDKDGNPVMNPNGGAFTVKGNENWTHLVEKSGNRKDVTDGYWYYNGILEKGAVAAALLDEVAVEEKPSNASRLEVKLLAEAIQAEGENAEGVPAAIDAWNVRVSFFDGGFVTWKLP